MKTTEKNKLTENLVVVDDMGSEFVRRDVVEELLSELLDVTLCRVADHVDVSKSVLDLHQRIESMRQPGRVAI